MKKKIILDSVFAATMLMTYADAAGMLPANRVRAGESESQAQLRVRLLRDLGIHQNRINEILGESVNGYNRARRMQAYINAIAAADAEIINVGNQRIQAVVQQLQNFGKNPTQVPGLQQFIGHFNDVNQTNALVAVLNAADREIARLNSEEIARRQREMLASFQAYP